MVGGGRVVAGRCLRQRQMCACFNGAWMRRTRGVRLQGAVVSQMRCSQTVRWVWEFAARKSAGPTMRRRRHSQTLAARHSSDPLP